jgi:hypothetical protein
LRCNEAVASQLKQIFSKHDRSTAAAGKAHAAGVAQRNPNVQRLIYQKVPTIVAADWDASEIGNVQVVCGALRSLDWWRLHPHNLGNGHRQQSVGRPGDRGALAAGQSRMAD